MYRQMDRWQRGAILLGSSWDRCSLPSPCPLATLKKKKTKKKQQKKKQVPCGIPPGPSPLIVCNFPIQMLTTGPLLFFFFYCKRSNWKAGFASTQRIRIWIWRWRVWTERVGVWWWGRKLFWGSSCLSEIMDAPPTKTNKGTELCEGRRSC